MPSTTPPPSMRPTINRLAALIGGTDPIAIDLGWADRWGYHLATAGRGCPCRRRIATDAILVRIDPDHAPPMGSNGFLFRRDLVLQVDYSPFFHPEVVADRRPPATGSHTCATASSIASRPTRVRRCTRSGRRGRYRGASGLPEGRAASGSGEHGPGSALVSERRRTGLRRDSRLSAQPRPGVVAVSAVAPGLDADLRLGLRGRDSSARWSVDGRAGRRARIQ